MDPITSIAVTPESVTLHAQEVTTIAYLDEEALSFSTDGNCSNFCFHGSCFFSEADSATCFCDEGWSGVRCETDPCHNLCLNDGESSSWTVTPSVCVSWASSGTGVR